MKSNHKDIPQREASGGTFEQRKVTVNEWIVDIMKDIAARCATLPKAEGIIQPRVFTGGFDLNGLNPTDIIIDEFP